MEEETWFLRSIGPRPGNLTLGCLSVLFDLPCQSRRGCGKAWGPRRPICSEVCQARHAMGRPGSREGRLLQPPPDGAEGAAMHLCGNPELLTLESRDEAPVLPTHTVQDWLNGDSVEALQMSAPRSEKRWGEGNTVLSSFRTIACGDPDMELCNVVADFVSPREDGVLEHGFVTAIIVCTCLKS